MAAMSATKHVVPLFLTVKLPRFGIEGCTEDVGITVCVGDGMMVLFWDGMTVLLCGIIVMLGDRVTVMLWEGITVVLCEGVTVVLWDGVKVVVREGKTVELGESVKVDVTVVCLEVVTVALEWSVDVTFVGLEIVADLLALSRAVTKDVKPRATIQ